MHAAPPEPDSHEPIQRIAIPTDLSSDSEQLFAHGLKIALQSKAHLYLVHIDEQEHPEATWRRLPTVRALLERWGHLPLNASYADFEALGIKVHALDRKTTDGDLRAAVAHRIAELSPDLVIIGTHARTGFQRLLSGSVAEPVARDVHKATLFVGAHARGLVDAETGDWLAKRILVPISSDVPQQPLIDQLTRLLQACGCGTLSFTLVHVGRSDTVPEPDLPRRADWRWKSDIRTGNVVEEILKAAVEHESDLIAMATHGHDSVLDALLGSTMERVLRRAACPVFAVPV
jgi:nucleotide-binding universal stress UspA family protein